MYVQKIVFGHFRINVRTKNKVRKRGEKREKMTTCIQEKFFDFLYVQ